MRQKDFQVIHRRFLGFIEEFKPVFQRQDRMTRCSQYLSGLILEGERKSIEPMALRLGNVSSRSLQDFMVEGLWDADELMGSLVSRTFSKFSENGILVLDDTALPKQGKHSVGVAPQYCGVLGKVANCQSLVSWHWVGKNTHVPMNARLYLPEAWTADKKRLKSAGVPKEYQKFKKKWQIALDLLDTITGKRTPDCVVFDAGYGEIPAFCRTLDERKLPFIGQIPDRMGFWPEDMKVDTNPSRVGKLGRPYKHPKVLDEDSKPKRAKLFAKDLNGQKHRWSKVKTRAGQVVDFCAVRVRQAQSQSFVCPGPERWLLIERLDDGGFKYYVSNLPDDTSIERLVYFAKSRWKIEQGYQQLKEELGLDHYEGRRWSGLHHHIALCFMAFHFLEEQRSTVSSKKKSSDAHTSGDKTMDQRSTANQSMPTL